MLGLKHINKMKFFMYPVYTLNTTGCPLMTLFHIELIFLLWVYWRFKIEFVLTGF